MGDDLPSLMKSLQAKNVRCTEIEQAQWGIKTTIKLPSGGEIGLYQPRHPLVPGGGIYSHQFQGLQESITNSGKVQY